jgi:hypothetical protein
VILKEDALKQMADPMFKVFPNKEVEKGKSWDTKSSLDMGPIGKYDSTYYYTFEGKDKDNAKVKVETDLKYTPPSGEQKDALPFAIKDAKLTSDKGKSTGTITIDVNKGRIENSRMDLNLKGNLKIEIAGVTTDVDLDQVQTTQVKTMDSKPSKLEYPQ